jgi:hypothetical protein
VVLTHEDGADTVLQNADTWNSDTRESPKRKNTTFRTQRKFEIKNNEFDFCVQQVDVLRSKI